MPRRCVSFRTRMCWPPCSLRAPRKLRRGQLRAVRELPIFALVMPSHAHERAPHE
jgi:hypothetical protein